MIQLGPILNYALGENAAPLRLDTYMFSSRPDYPETSSLLLPPGLGRHLPRLSRRDDLFYEVPTASAELEEKPSPNNRLCFQFGAPLQR